VHYDEVVIIPALDRIRITRIEIPLQSSLFRPNLPPLEIWTTFLIEFLNDQDDYGFACYDLPIEKQNITEITQEWRKLQTELIPTVSECLRRLKNRTLWVFLRELMEHPTFERAPAILVPIEIALWEFCAHHVFITGAEMLWRTYFLIGGGYYSSEDIDIMQERSKQRLPRKIYIPLNHPNPEKMIKIGIDQGCWTYSIELPHNNQTATEYIQQIRNQFPEITIDGKWNYGQSEFMKKPENIFNFCKELQRYNLRMLQHPAILTSTAEIPLEQWGNECSNIFVKNYPNLDLDWESQLFRFAQDYPNRLQIAIDIQNNGIYKILSGLDRLDTYNGRYPGATIGWFLDSPICSETYTWVGLTAATLPVPISESILPDTNLYQSLSLFRNPIACERNCFPALDHRIGFYPDRARGVIQKISKEVWSFRFPN
jgi:hypothetical protein